MTDEATATDGEGAGEGIAAQPPLLRDLLPEDMRDAMAYKPYADKPVAELARGYAGLVQKLGVGAIAKPPEGDALKDWEGWKALGVPDDGKYEIAKPDLPEGLPWNEDLQAAFLPVAHDLRLTPYQAQGLVNFIGQFTGSAFETDMARRDGEKQSIESNLRKEWGTGYDHKLGLAKQAFREFIGDDEAAFGALNEIAGGEAVLKLFGRLGEMIGEDGLKGQGITALLGTSREAQEARVSEITAELGTLVGKEDPASKARMKKLEDERRNIWHVLKPGVAA